MGTWTVHAVVLSLWLIINCAICFGGAYIGVVICWSNTSAWWAGVITVLLSLYFSWVTGSVCRKFF